MVDNILKRANLDYVSRFILCGSEPLNVENNCNADVLSNKRVNLFKDKLNDMLGNEELQKEIIGNLQTLLKTYQEVYFEVGVQAGKQLQQINLL